MVWTTLLLSLFLEDFVSSNAEKRIICKGNIFDIWE
jgi:hypothetical protein